MHNTHTQLFLENRPFTGKPSCDLDVLFIRRHVENIKMAKFEAPGNKECDTTPV